MNDEEIEISMQKAIKKLPFEIKKIKFILALIKLLKKNK